MKHKISIEQDGLRGWVVVFAAFTTHFLTQGIVYSFGILFISFEDTFGSSKAETSWIASLMCGALYLSGINYLKGPLFLRNAFICYFSEAL
jgi:uncharacterized membrane protein